MISRKALRVSLVLLFTLLIVFSGFASGKKAVEQTAATGKVTYWFFPWSPTYEKLVDKLAEEFEAENPGIDVEPVAHPWSGREAKFMAAIAANESPDVTTVGADVAAKIEDADGLIDLESYNLNLSDWYERLIDDTKIKGKMYGLPLAIETTSQTYNVKLLKDAGFGTSFNDLPGTFSDYAEAMKKLTKDINGDGTVDQYGTNWNPGGSAWATFVPYLQASGGSIFSADGKKAVFNEAPGVETLSWFTDMHLKSKVIPPGVVASHQAMYDLVLGGKTATLVHSDGDFLADIAREYPQMEIVTGPALKNKERVAQGWIGIAILFKQSKAKEAAVKWIQFLGRDDINVRILEDCGYVSVKKTVSNKKTASISPAMAEAMNQTQKFGRPPTAHWLSRDVNGPLKPALQGAFLGEKSPQEALNEAAKAVQKWLDERN